ncbi:hypothetical protein OROHE_003893 [Orobanche hederae]
MKFSAGREARLVVSVDERSQSRDGSPSSSSSAFLGCEIYGDVNSNENSRFSDIPILEGKENLEISGKISTSLLSSNAAYTAYLLFTFEDEFGGFGEEQPLETFVGIDGGGCETENRIVYIPFLLSLFYQYRRAEYPKLRSQYPEFTGPQYPVRRADG